MKRKRHPDKFNPDKYKDGPKAPKLKSRSSWDDENLDDAFDEWADMRQWSETLDDEYEDQDEEGYEGDDYNDDDDDSYSEEE